MGPTRQGQRIGGPIGNSLPAVLQNDSTGTHSDQPHYRTVMRRNAEIPVPD
jgi:hypothetical protein